MDWTAYVGTLLRSSLALYLAAILIGIACRASRTGATISFSLTAAASLCTLPIPFIYGFVRPPPLHTTIELVGVEMPIYIDALSAVLLFVVSILTLASSIYSLDYMDHYREIGMQGCFAALFSLFSVSMMLVTVVNSALWFLFMWEVMTLASYFLINWEYTRESVRRAAWRYFVTMHFLSTLPLVIAIATLVSLTGCDSLTKLREFVPQLNPGLLGLLQSLFLVGFGSKAGIVPMHFWLPDAHPAAPSNVSALLSGAMIKVAVYGVIRFCTFVLPPNYVLGMVIAVMGALSLTLGTLMALRQTDVKRMLAYSSIGQMGYIWLGIGTGIALATINSSLAIIGFVAGLYHLVNHALFKGLLFLSSGSIIYRAHSTDLNSLGGLSKYMPYTAALTLVGGLSIAGVPPLNGFVSKWLIYESTFLSGNGILVFCGVLALFVSAMTVAYFLKLYSSIFEGKPKIPKVSEVPKSMIVGKAILAALCIVTGLLPVVIVKLLANAFATVFPWLSSSSLLISVAFVGVRGVSWYVPLALLAMVATILGLGFVSCMPRTRIVEAWMCGSEVEVERYRMVAVHYYRAYEEYIHALYHVSHALAKEFGGSLQSSAKALMKFTFAIADSLTKAFSKLVRGIGTYIASSVREVYLDEAVAMPVIKALKVLSSLASRIATGTDVDTFLAYSALFILVVSVIVIVFALGV